MPIGTFMGLQTALRGILAQQQALDTTGHNIANANTVGFTRQEALLAPTPAYSEPSTTRGAQAGQIGTGVEVTAYRRIRDEFIDTQLHAQTMREGYYGALSDGLTQVEQVVRRVSDHLRALDLVVQLRDGRSVGIDLVEGRGGIRRRL